MNENSYSSDEILGRGVAFPLQLAGGIVGTNAYENQVKQSILLILQTTPGERMMRPDFGAGMETLAFEPMSAITTALAQHRIQEALDRFEPRINVLNVTVNTEQSEGKLMVDIQYRVTRTGSVFNLVYPFYIERGVL
ncbi:MAG TPA: GPW/gp25 family protein [Nitrosomonas sp.]|nr:GPW/gp25 family protein [Nitrosomonas sp.]